MIYFELLSLLFLSHIHGVASLPPPVRPSSLIDTPTGVVHYFAVGSNLSRHKLENRAPGNSTIKLLSFEPAVVEQHRLAFNLKGFPPLEPGMGGIEPSSTSTIHGALVSLSRSEYEKVWLSEGGGSSNPSYYEYPVSAVPYNSTTPIPAISFRARPHARLKTDASPSLRYLNLLILGATELNLHQSYLDYLKSIPTQNPSTFLRFMSVNSFFITGLMWKLKCRWLLKPSTTLLWLVYRPASSSRLSLFLSEVMSCFILAPLCVGGLGVRGFRKVLGKEVSPMMKMIMKRPKEEER
ncbi:hypothetical protein TrVE_jg11763 [Triparma verrucosa]|uniref:gamma-glutamylcyclotransferase n=1 Tax=Triparma verrucosa TaxID=1606542 RepID=A0A9W7F989_9STRA|nr:hypothetical protein TrVE_jg11763 [Triparma verrucosa]